MTVRSTGRRGPDVRRLVALLVALALTGACTTVGGGPPLADDDVKVPWCHDPAGVGTPVRVDDGRAEFSVYAPRRGSVTVLVHDPESLERRAAVALERRTAEGDCDVWQGSVEVGDGPFAYRLEVDGDVMADPWSAELDPSGRFSLHDPDLALDAPDPLPPSNGAPTLYEAHVAASTADLGGLADERRCTFSGLEANVEAMEALGVGAVHLLPVTATTQVTGPDASGVGARPCEAMEEGAPGTDGRRAFHKGYDVASVSALNPAYGDAASFQELVRTFHRAGIGVYLDVVITHLAPGSLLERLDRDTYLDFNGNGRADLTSATDADSSAYGPIPALENPTVEALVTAALGRFIDVYGVDGLRIDGLSVLRTYERDAQQVVIDMVTVLERDRPGLDVVVETLPLRTAGTVSEFYWQEDAGPSEAITELLAGLVVGDRERTEAALAWFRHVAAPDESEVPVRRVIFTASHDHEGSGGAAGATDADPALLESAAAGLLALTAGRLQLAYGQECADGAVVPRPPYLVAVRAADHDAPACRDEGLRSFIRLLLAHPADGEGGEPVPVLSDGASLVLARAGRLLVINLGDTDRPLEAPLCLGAVLAATLPAPSPGTCLDALPARTVVVSTSA